MRERKMSKNEKKKGIYYKRSYGAGGRRDSFPGDEGDGEASWI